MANTTTAKPQKEPRIKPAKAKEAMASYAPEAGVLSFRHSLTTRENGILDRALAILARCLQEPREVLGSPDAVKAFLRLHLAGEKREVFGVMFLDSQNRLIAFEQMFTGTLTQTSVYPREVAAAALAHHAAAVVLAHNHPSGKTAPSKADETLTRNLKNALALIDVRVLDHVVVAPTGSTSMAERGLMS